jgi:hypothetical protein
MSLMYSKKSGILISIFFIAAIVAASWYALEEINQQTRHRARDTLQTVLLTTQEALHIWISQRKLDTSNLAQSDELLRLTTTLLNAFDNKNTSEKKHTQEQIRNFMAPRLARYGDRDFFIISPDRKSLASMASTTHTMTNPIHKYRKEHLDRAFEGSTVFIPTIRFNSSSRIRSTLLADSEPAIFTASPIKSFNGKIVAVLAIHINPKRQFTHITQLGRIGETGESYAFDEQGTLISESRFDDQLRRIGLVDSGRRGILSIRIVDPGGNMLQGYQPDIAPEEMPMTRMAASATKGKAGYDTNGYRDYRGIRVLGAWTWDKKLGFGLTTEQDEAEAMQPFYEARLIILLIAALAVIFCVVMEILYSRLHRQAG